MTPLTDQHINLDRLGLLDGERYSFNLFYAHRNSFSAVFRLKTNIELQSHGLPSITAVFD